MRDFIERLFLDPAMLRMGHHQRLEDQNLGLGWIYYALGRLLRPSSAVVIGSYRGFVPAVIGKALLENTEDGEVVFIDPSYVDDFWKDPAVVHAYFQALGTPNIRHQRCTTQEFLATEAYAELSDIGLLMIDGYHSAEQARFDYLAFLDKLSDGSIVLFHDSIHRLRSDIYGEDRIYDHTVYRLIERLGQTPGLEVFTLPFDSGVTLVRGRPRDRAMIEAPFEDDGRQALASVRHQPGGGRLPVVGE